MTAFTRRIAAYILSVCLAAAAALPALGAEGDVMGSFPDGSKARVSLGVTFDYVWWDPVWGRISQVGDMLVYYLLNQGGPQLKFEKPSRVYEVDPAPLGGISLDVVFPGGWGVAASAEAGAYRDSSVMVASLTTNTFAPSEYIKYTIDTVNIRSSLFGTYRFAEWGMVSLGPVYRVCILSDRSTSYFRTQTWRETIHDAGLSAGASFNVRLVDNLFIRPSASFMYLYGTVTGQSSLSSRRHSHAVGGEAAASLAYFAEKIRVTFSVGFRYSFLNYLEVTNQDYLNRWDHRYGLTESITYTF